jgi:hypothetical protein
MVNLYHYTDKRGYEAIKSSGKVLKSTDTAHDAKFGVGVYLTSLSPKDRSKIVISKNNYDGARGGPFAQNQVDDGKVDYWFEFDIPDGKLSKCPSKRDVWLFLNNDISFADYPPTNHGDFNSFGKAKPSSEELQKLKDFLDLSIKSTSSALPWAALASLILQRVASAQ